MTRHGAILTTANANVPGITIPTPGAAITIDLTTGSTVYKWTAGEIETVNASGAQFVGMEVIVMIVNDITLGRVITFGTGFVSSGVVTGVISKTSIVRFISDGTNLYETGRTVGI